MFASLKRNSQTIAVAMVTAAVTAGAPAVAASFADNADKVDGFHAVGSKATAEERAGKLVATNGRTGRLPNGIIDKAPDSDLLDGKDSAAFAEDSEILPTVLAGDGAGSGLDADLLDGVSSYFYEPWMRAQTDDDAGGTVVKDETAYLVNNIMNFHAPSSGTLTVSGSVFVNNDETTIPPGGLLFTLSPEVNTRALTPNDGAAAFQPAASAGTPGNPAERFTLSYTVTVPVLTSGVFRVRQWLEAQQIDGTPVAADYFFNRANLTAVFTPGGDTDPYTQPDSEQ